MPVEEISSEQKVQIILEGMKKGKAEVCNKYGVSESKFEQWKKKIIDSAESIFNLETKTQEKIDRAVRKALRQYRLKFKQVR